MQNKYIVTKETLELYDKYEADFGLLDERWASKGDREILSGEQSRVLGEYVDALHFLKVEYLSQDLRLKTLDRIRELEALIDVTVVVELKRRCGT